MPELLTAERKADLASIQAVSRWINTDGTTVHALDYGGDAPVCIIVPGITTPAIGWDFVVRELLDRMRPIVIDVRGRGLSDRSSSYTTADYVADVEGLWPALNLSESTTLLGHSMGARVVAAVDARGRVPLRGVVLIDPPMSGPYRGPYPTPLESFKAQLAAARAGTGAEEIAATYPGWPVRELELRARWLATCDEKAVEESHAAFESEDFFETWPQVTSSAALIHGAESPVVTSEGAAEAATANPNAVLVPVEAAGHMVPWDNYQGFLDAVRSLSITARQSGEPNTRSKETS